MSLLADYNLPFAIALAIMGLFLVLQLIGLGDFDFGPDVEIDVDPGTNIDGDLTSASLGGAFVTLLGLGRVPLAVWLVVFLLLFAMLGLSIQALAMDLTGSPLFSLLAALFAGGAAVPVTSMLVRPLGRILPQDETSAVALNSLVGRRAKIITGRASAGNPARAQVRDRYGHAHYVMVEPHEASSEILEGDEVLLVRREGQQFFGIPLAERTLAPLA